MASGIKTVWLMSAGIAAAVVSTSAVRATTQEDFHVKTTGDLVDLCATPTSDPLYTAAINFCQGFMVGAYQYHNLAVQAEGRQPLVCPPNPPPTRDESIARFVAWSHSHPSALSTAPVEGMFEFLTQTYPCRS
ncbi:MAG: Rap1a/Tai family immunity protein [Magnetospirillum sp.]|nr:Rap1a/Tai family immunity protein [Magnetospirillum sp.]